MVEKCIIGIDFDNTIICYDSVFNKVGVEKGLIPADLPVGKNFVKENLISRDLEEQWTWLQGHVYGKRIMDAAPYDGFKGFLSFCRSCGIECVIISHKTVYPYSGEKHNLHDAAGEWLSKHEFGLDVFFELTKADKIKRINETDCSVFIDDLPQFLSLPGFNRRIKKILFDPLQNFPDFYKKFLYAVSWKEIVSMCRENNFFR